MKRNALAALAACLSIVCLGAQASVWSSAQLGDGQQQFSDPVWGNFDSWDEVKSLAPGQTWTVTVPYHIGLTSTGYALSGPSFPQCTSTFPTACQRPYDGKEFAEAYLYWVVDTRYGQYDNIDVSFSSDQDFYLNQGSANYSGLMTFTATNVGMDTSYVQAALLTGLFANAATVPEPASAALTIAGLLLVASRRRQTGVSGETTW